jgi:hypothetical protein
VFNDTFAGGKMVMDSQMQQIVDSIASLPGHWHGAGTVTREVLLAIIHHAGAIGTIHHSVETGSGKTTLLFSHLSKDHVVFAVDAGKSISQVKCSPLFNASRTVFVEGPTQRTLPKHHFANKHQVVLLDGPHGYPFPDLEYYYLYPTVDTGGLLVIDDIRIPTIVRMFDIVRADGMFDVIEVVNNNTAFLRRTGSPVIDPESDSWWLQGFNRAHFDHLSRPMSKGASLLYATSRIIPKRIKQYIPARLKRMFYP